MKSIHVYVALSTQKHIFSSRNQNLFYFFQYYIYVTGSSGGPSHWPALFISLLLLNIILPDLSILKPGPISQKTFLQLYSLPPAKYFQAL